MKSPLTGEASGPMGVSTHRRSDVGVLVGDFLSSLAEAGPEGMAMIRKKAAAVVLVIFDVILLMVYVLDVMLLRGPPQNNPAITITTLAIPMSGDHHDHQVAILNSVR